MNHSDITEDSIVLVQIGSIQVNARVIEYISNGNILVYLSEHSLNGERFISVALSDIVGFVPIPEIDDSVTTINQIIPTSLSGQSPYIENTNILRNILEGGRKSRNTHLKQKRSKRY